MVSFYSLNFVIGFSKTREVADEIFNKILSVTKPGGIIRIYPSSMYLERELIPRLLQEGVIADYAVEEEHGKGISLHIVKPAN